MKKSIFLFIVFLMLPVMNYSQLKSPVLLPVKDDPTITFKIMFPAGSQYDPKGKEGLAYLTAAMISEGGTKNNTYEAVLEKLYPLAASYDIVLGVETATFTGRVHKDNLDSYYALMMDALLYPAFNESDFIRIKENVLNYLNTTLKYSSDEELGKAVLYNKIYEGTPYGHLTAGTITGLNNITLEDIKGFYSKYYNRNNYILALGGGYEDALPGSQETLETRIVQDLKNLPADDSVTGETMPMIENSQPPELLVNKINGINITVVEKDAASTAISMGYPINVRRGQREWYALAIANSWFGEHRNSSSHLYQVIREERGLNYGNYSYIEHFPNGGSYQMPPVNYPRRQHLFEIWIRPVPNEARHFSLRAALRELKKLADNGLTREQFDLTKNFLSKYVLHYAPSTSKRLGYALDDRFYEIEGHHLELFREMVNEITLEEVNAAIKKHLQYENMHIAVITPDAEEFKKALVNNSESPIEYASSKPAHILDEDKEIIKFQLKVPAENVKIVKVEDLFK